MKIKILTELKALGELISFSSGTVMEYYIVSLGGGCTAFRDSVVVPSSRIEFQWSKSFNNVSFETKAAKD